MRKYFANCTRGANILIDLTQPAGIRAMQNLLDFHHALLKANQQKTSGAISMLESVRTDATFPGLKPRRLAHFKLDAATITASQSATWTPGLEVAHSHATPR